MLQSHFHTGAIDESFESLKKSFNILALLAPPKTNAEEYTAFVNSSKNLDADIFLEQPSEKRAAVKKDIFIKGRQNTLDDVITFISNIVTFAKFWVKDEPLVIQTLVELADYLSSAEFRSFDEKFRDNHNYMAHTLVTYIFNIFSIFVKMAKNPKICRKFQIENVIERREIRLAGIMHTNLMEQLQLCAVTSSLQNVFARPPTSFKIFCPALFAANKSASLAANKSQTCPLIGQKRPLSTPNPNDPNKKRIFGSIINTTGQRIIFPKGLEKKYCSDFLDTSRFCSHGDSCTFVHAAFPKDFSDNDKQIVTKFVNETEGLSFAKKNVSEEKKED